MSSELTESITTPNKPSTPSFIGGVYLPSLSNNAFSSIQKSLNDGFDFAVTDLPVLGSNEVARTDVTRLDSKWWSTSVVGLVNDPPKWKQDASQQPPATYAGMELLKALTSTSISAAASAKRNEANAILKGMLEWASHMNIPAVILPPVPLTEFNDDEDDDMFDANSPPQSVNINNSSAKEYARLLSSLATSATCTMSHVKLWVRVPLSLSGIRAFQLLLARCDHNSAIGGMLYVDCLLDAMEMPEVIKELHLLCGGGSIKAMSWDVSCFLKNKRGFPTMSKSHQFVFQQMFSRLGRTLRLLVEGEVGPEGVLVPAPTKAVKQPIGQFGGGSTGRLNHLQYLRHLRSRPEVAHVLDDEEAIMETPYLDHLQSPLQPLGDHLEYQTYETFEKDPVKYKNYGDAITYALEDGIKDGRYKHLGSTQTTRGQLKKMVSHPNGDGDVLFDDVEVVVGTDGQVVEVDIYEVTILVVGAGRGPLVREAVRAVSRVSALLINNASKGQEKRKALHGKVIAVEKNPSAILYLQSLKSSEASWNGGETAGSGGDGRIAVPGTSNVTVVGCDMRQAADSILKYMVENPSLRGDIVVSELLGSFGDNELSPECLDGAQACGILKDMCVSIPQSYTAFLAPVSSTRLHNEAKNESCHPLNPNAGPPGPSIGLQRAMETPYVVRSHAASQTHKEQACWTYTHPHSTKSTKAMDTDADQNLSAEAAKNVNNDRHAHLSFRHDPTHGVAMGCGYGASDPEMQAMVTATAEKATSDSADNSSMMIHGLLGTFHSVLYESNDKTKLSTISIAPHSFSVGMFSWFPLYFPLREPLLVPPKASINCSIWRRSDSERVWYEWCAEVTSNEGAEEVVLSTCYVHNPAGRSYHVRL